MKIKMRYEDAYQTLEVETKEIEKWLNISITEEESQEDYEKRIQDVIEERFNRPDYNSWHKHDRHTGNAYMKSKDGTVEVNTEEAIMFRATDKSAFSSSIDGVHNKIEYEEYCEILRSLLKPEIADMVIAIALDDMSVGEYAELIGGDSNNISHRLIQLQKNIEEVLLDDGSEELEEIDRCMAGLQEKLVMSVNDNEKYDSITKQMDILRERKALILSKGAEYDAMQKRIAEMKQFLETQTGRVTEYDEQMVRRLISKITVFEDKLIFEFKSGMTIDLRR